METFLDHMLALIAPMYDEVYGVSNRPANFYFVGTGRAGLPAPCTDTKGNSLLTSDQDFYYCPTDQSIYTGQEQLWRYYYDIGDAAPFVAYAHEWGHHIQTISGVHNDLADNATAEQVRVHSIRLENQADCFAGVWLFYADTKGWLEYPDDAGDIGQILQEIASSDANPERDHGNLEERTASLLHGYNQGLRGCNAFFPNTPIYQG
ncbi:neutral zinc metallopeptidase [Arthrobacter sp. W4I7]|uniref:neutral zinc metallopeptidase n=1 Tax=Arthrobacter sp. W4I7 TaxID=3042296 RepID=UPI0027809708|nr:neutral zinc metallopeptidase [Arthrobacter sp. W4I7]MDQ0693202.1 putative metalloprotease [Arthrobacter sp. W4I7]